MAVFFGEITTILAVVWAAATTALIANGVRDPDWRAADQSVAKLAVVNALLVAVEIGIAIGLILVFRALVPFTTIRGRTVSALTDEFVAVTIVAASGYLTVLGRRGRLFDADEALFSAPALRRIWTVLGVTMAVSALVVGIGPIVGLEF